MLAHAAAAQVFKTVTPTAPGSPISCAGVLRNAWCGSSSLLRPASVGSSSSCDGGLSGVMMFGSADAQSRRRRQSHATAVTCAERNGGDICSCPIYARASKERVSLLPLVSSRIVNMERSPNLLPKHTHLHAHTAYSEPPKHPTHAHLHAHTRT